MDALASKLVWFFANAGVLDVIGPLLLPLVIGVVLYHSHQPFVLMRALYRRARGDVFVPLRSDERASILVVMPSLLRSKDEVRGMITSLESAIASGYPGTMTLCASIDGRGGASASHYAALEAWAAAQRLPRGVHLIVTGTDPRHGKAMAVDHGLREVLAACERGEIEDRPTVFFNMDADCVLAPRALDRMVRELLRRSRWSGERGMVVTSHVFVEPAHAWRGWARFFTVEGQLALAVAREYLVALGLGRYNDFRLLPQLGASGALYCTWMEIASSGPKFARFMDGLRWRDWAMWWLGAAPPAYRPERLEPLPEAMTGMGDDTWMSFLACVARWEGDRIVLDLPRTPAHAIYYAMRGYLFRPYRYDPHAKIHTESPTSVRALFKQRARWNVSRIWTVQKWGIALFYHLRLGLPAIADVLISTVFQATIVAGILMIPFASRPPPMWFAMVIVVEIFYLCERTISTFLGLLIDGSLWRNRHLFLALPLAGWFHFVFNVGSTIWGFGAQVFGTGLDDGFAPAQTMVRGRTGRIALGYRIGRATRLAVRSVVRGDVPLGAWWLGWEGNQYVENGYEALTRKPTRVIAASSETATVSVVDPPTSTPATDDEELEVITGVRAKRPASTEAVAKTG